MLEAVFTAFAQCIGLHLVVKAGYRLEQDVQIFLVTELELHFEVEAYRGIVVYPGRRRV